MLGHKSFTKKILNQIKNFSEFNIPPNSITQIDHLQLSALFAVSNLAKELHINFNTIDKTKVSVLSASILGLDASFDFANRIKHFEFIDALSTFNAELIDTVIKHKEKYPKVTEDTGPGILNNVTAGRVANYFNFSGFNFNIDADFNSLPLALNIGVVNLAEKNGMIIILAAHESFNKKKIRIERNGMTCFFLASKDYAKDYNLPIKSTITNIIYGEKNEKYTTKRG